MHVFLAGSPLQVLGAIEAYWHYEVPAAERVLVVGSSREFAGRPMEQVRSAVEYGDWGRVVWLDPTHRLRWLHQFGKVATRLKRELGAVSAVYMGSYRSAAMNNAVRVLSPERTVLLDDGIMTIAVADERRAGLFGVPSAGPIRTSVLRALGLKLAPIRELEFFTSYDVDIGASDTLARCEYQWLQAMLVEKESDGSTMILGAPLIEDRVMSASTYVEILRTVIDSCPRGHVSYFAHRRESSENLDQIAAGCGVTVERPEACLELSLLGMERLPSRIVGLFSSALVTSAMLVGDSVEVVSFRPLLDEVAAAHRTRVDGAYAVLERTPRLRVRRLQQD